MIDLDAAPLDVIEFRRAELVGWDDEMGPGLAVGRVLSVRPLDDLVMGCAGVLIRVPWDELVSLRALRGRAA